MNAFTSTIPALLLAASSLVGFCGDPPFMLNPLGVSRSTVGTDPSLAGYGGRTLFACARADRENVSYFFPQNQTLALQAYNMPRRQPELVCPLNHELERVAIPRRATWGGFGLGGGAWVYSTNQEPGSASVGLTSQLHFLHFGIDLDRVGRRRGVAQESEGTSAVGVVEGSVQYNVAAVRLNARSSEDSAFVTSVSARLQAFVGAHLLRPNHNVGFYTGVNVSGNMGTALNALGYSNLEGRVGPESGLIFRIGDGDFIMLSPSVGIRGTGRNIGDGTGRTVTSNDVDVAAIARASFGQRLLLQAMTGSSAYRIGGSHTSTYFQSSGTLRLNQEMRLVAVVNYNNSHNPVNDASFQGSLSTIEATLTWIQDF